MRRRVTIGFGSIVCLLFFSGMVSLFELSRLSRDTDDILQTSKRNIELAREMLDAAHGHNVSMIRLAVFGDRGSDSLCVASLERLENTLLVAQHEALEKSYLDSLSFVTTELRLLTDSYLAFGAVERAAKPQARFRADSLGARWYNDQYEAVYGRLTSAIKGYINTLISLVVMIAIVLMLFYFMLIYSVNPILRMNKGLGDWLAFRVPFAVAGDLKDEMLELKEKIDTLIGLCRQHKA